MLKKIAFFIFVASFLSSCATRSIHDFTVDELVATARVDQSDFSQTIAINGINISQQNSPTSVLFIPQIDYENFFLRSIVDRSSKEVLTHQIYVSVTYRGDWRFYRSANLLGGDSLEVLQISSNVISCADSQLTGCRVSEDFAVNLTDAQFTDALERGITFRANTSFSGIHSDYTIPASVFQAQARIIAAL